MQYMGSKRRIAKDILPIILKDRKPDQYYVEPFVGGGNIIDKVDGKRIGADINPYVIEALISIRDFVNELPKNNKEFTEEDYYAVKNGRPYKHKGFVGFAYSFGGKWFSGWSRGRRHTYNRDYVAEAYRNALKQSKLLKGVELVNKSYLDLEIPLNSIIYCDPPYRGTAKYKNIQNFDYELFYNWCRQKHKEGHQVFVSEYSMPEDFICIWQKEIKCHLPARKPPQVKTEKLFTLK